MNRFLAAIPAIVIALPAYASDFTKYDKASFDQILASGKPVLVHVHADWCPTCKKQLSAFPEALKDAKDLHRIVVSFDNDAEFKSKYAVRGQSTLILFKDGKEIGRSVGATDPAAIKALVAKAM